ncbi:MAG: SAM-dependent methyltransferase, partial [Candidatus Syntrophonatronum acetioxidans]
MIKLTPRLKTIASLVPEGSIAADIGADHGYLSVFLVEQGICPKVIAGEKNEKPLKKARELVKSMELEDRVLIRLGDGLEVIKKGYKVNTVIIAGMGGQTLVNILRKDYHKLKDIETLILQPMTDIPQVRKWLIENNYKIAREELAREGKQFYEIIVAEPG